MTLSGIMLSHIRSHAQYVLHFDAPTVLVIGQNASGKTTLIEAIHMLATGESFRATKVDELIQFGADLGRIKGKITHASSDMSDKENDDNDEIEIIITHGEVQGTKSAKRLYVVNGVKRLRKLATSFFKTVVFRPEDMRLIEGSPGRRRSFLDTPLSQLAREYKDSLHTYEQTLIRRNKLLLQVRDRMQPASSLTFWDLSLVKHGEVVQKLRQEFLHAYSSVTFPVTFGVTYLPSIISTDRLNEYRPREIAAGHTLIGPHKDDFMVEITKKVQLAGTKEKELKTIDVAQFGSRGEQRLAVLWLKFGELAYLEQKTGKKPVLLLDDILSELDDQSQSIALSVLKNYQSVITTTDQDMVQTVEPHVGSLQLLQL